MPSLAAAGGSDAIRSSRSARAKISTGPGRANAVAYDVFKNARNDGWKGMPGEVLSTFAISVMSASNSSRLAGLSTHNRASAPSSCIVATICSRSQTLRDSPHTKRIANRASWLSDAFDLVKGVVGQASGSMDQLTRALTATAAKIWVKFSPDDPEFLGGPAHYGHSGETGCLRTMATAGETGVPAAYSIAIHAGPCLMTLISKLFGSFPGSEPQESSRLSLASRFHTHTHTPSPAALTMAPTRTADAAALDSDSDGGVQRRVRHRSDVSDDSGDDGDDSDDGDDGDDGDESYVDDDEHSNLEEPAAPLWLGDEAFLDEDGGVGRQLLAVADEFPPTYATGRKVTKPTDVLARVVTCVDFFANYAWGELSEEGAIELIPDTGRVRDLADELLEAMETIDNHLTYADGDDRRRGRWDNSPINFLGCVAYTVMLIDTLTQTINVVISNQERNAALADLGGAKDWSSADLEEWMTDWRAALVDALQAVSGNLSLRAVIAGMLQNFPEEDTLSTEIEVEELDEA